MVRRGENIYKRKDGRWEGRYIKDRKENGRIIYGYIYSKNYLDLKNKLIISKSLYQENYSDIKFNDFTFEGTLKECIPIWQKEIFNVVKSSTYASYCHKMENYIVPSLGEYKVRNIDKKIIESWLLKLKNKLASSSIRVVFLTLKSFFKVLKIKKLIIVNPCNAIVLKENNSRRNKALSENEQLILQKNSHKHPKGLAVNLALETGLRIGELSGLKWCDIDFDLNILHVRRTVQRINNPDKKSNTKTIILIGKPKTTYAERDIPITSNMSNLLLKSKKTNSGEFVFGGEKPAEPRVMSNWLKSISKDALGKTVNFHLLRHSFATRCIEKQVPVTTISELLGHSSVKMTLDIYTSSFLEEKRKAIELIT
ncbi:tyrosine-type recombinase/integrase [Vagococcus fluvialis]|uniref:Site-specific integrase n=1 Tax=Vagococcus fluvialis TaxID=2738 RepID=A0A7X6I3F5_9ENTE|nr:site-specific integrase [Vagococcus fluvialis]NKC68528.1 site-specific integrase [Vagococcus fluvialis]